MSGDDGLKLGLPTVFQKCIAIAARCFHLGKKISRHSVAECYTLCSYSNLDHVALEAVIHFKNNSTVSSDTYTNTDHFPFYTDSDRMTALWMTRVAESNQCPKIPLSGNDPSPPCGCHSSLEGMAHLHAVSRKADHTSPAPAPLPISNDTGILTPPTAGTGPASSCGHSPESDKNQPLPTLSTSLAIRPSGHSSPSPRPIIQDGSVLSTFLRLIFLGLIVACSSAAADRLTLSSLVGFLHACPAVMANHFALRNRYGTVEARYHLTAYDCSDPTEIQAYSSLPASQCSVRATPVQRDRPTRFQVLQKERKGYITAYSCFLSRTDIRGAYRHPELDLIHWSFVVPKRVTVEQCMAWLRTRTYRPTAYSNMMHGKHFHQTILVYKPNYITYMVYGWTYTKAPVLPTDQVSETLAKANGWSTRRTLLSTTWSPIMTSCTCGLSTWLLRMGRLSIKTDSGPFHARGRLDSATPRVTPTFGTLRSPTTDRSP